ncbi:MAG: PAS domain S-box protein [Spartobacteria bacterium]|nr:PAS domain S-box protein [Spartobacteria bacterium]
MNHTTEAILESISDGVFTVDSQWKIVSFNRAAEQITGIPREEAIGQFCCEVFRSNMCETGCALRRTLETGTPVINQMGYIINADGERMPVSISTAVLRSREGQVIGGAETFRDLSEIETLRKELVGRYQLGDFVSRSSSMQQVFQLAEAVAVSSSTLLIQGETGTGKEVLARAIHHAGPRKKEPFVAVNCGALPDNLLESELFGYKKGAFTGADHDKPGRFALAGEGTLFLDEIGEVSPALQVRLLRVLQDHVFEPLGGTRSEPCKARIIAATHRDLHAMVEEGTFRQDLFYRVHIIAIDIPPLHRRKDDIPLLANHFIQRFNFLQNRAIQSIHPAAMELLLAYDWPGNVRELENIIERAFVLCSTDVIEPVHLPSSFSAVIKLPSEKEPIQQIRGDAESQAIRTALRQHNNNREAAAKALGIHKTTLYRKMRKLGLTLPEQDGRSASS